MEETSLPLKYAFLNVVDNQLETNNPPEAREAFNRLTAEGLSESDAKIYIAQAVAYETWEIMVNKKEYDDDRYLRNLKNLPREPGA